MSALRPEPATNGTAGRLTPSCELVGQQIAPQVPL
jgi:hypothetical protein